MNEHGWTRRIVNHALRMGLLAYWNPDSRVGVGSRGIPDIVAAGQHGVIFAEIKTEYGETTASQDLWAWTIHEAGRDSRDRLRYRLWIVPADWDNETITRDLEKIR